MSRRRVHFGLGEVCATAGLLARVSMAEIAEGIARHQRGDWGSLSRADKRANEEALANGSRLLSSYEARCGASFWIITEADRSATTVLLPGEH